jgi:hypothetical protein
MKTKFISDDGFEFDSKYQCKKYEESRNNYDNVSGLKSANIEGEMIYEINSVEELVYYHDHINNGKMDKDIFYYFFCLIRDSNYKFPIYFFSNTNTSDKKLRDRLENEIDEENEKIDAIKENIKRKRQEIKRIKDIKSKMNELPERTVGDQQS